jgi:hypothetical protein
LLEYPNRTIYKLHIPIYSPNSVSLPLPSRETAAAVHTPAAARRRRFVGEGLRGEELCGLREVFHDDFEPE